MPKLNNSDENNRADEQSKNQANSTKDSNVGSNYLPPLPQGLITDDLRSAAVLLSASSRAQQIQIQRMLKTFDSVYGRDQIALVRRVLDSSSSPVLLAAQASAKQLADLHIIPMQVIANHVAALQQSLADVLAAFGRNALFDIAKQLDLLAPQITQIHLEAVREALLPGLKQHGDNGMQAPLARTPNV